MSGRPVRRASPLEALRAAAWSLGVVLLLGAIALPFLHARVYASGFAAEIVEAAEAMADAQAGILIRTERFAPEKAAAAATDRIATQAFFADDGRLALRAMTAPEAVSRDWLSAMIYEVRINAAGEVSEGRWLFGE